jgi:hypothetical protein
MTISAILALALMALATGALKPSEGNPNPLIEAEEAKSISARRGHYKKTRSGINNMSAAQRPHWAALAYQNIIAHPSRFEAF